MRRSKQAQANPMAPGTNLWWFNRFRTRAMPSFLDDLVSLEHAGLSEEQCKQVQKALSNIISEISEGKSLPEGGFLRDVVVGDLRRFGDLYIIWNSHGGPDAAKLRKLTLKRMRNKREKLAKRVRKSGNQAMLSNELDGQLIKGIYEHLSGLTRALPGQFSKLERAVAHPSARGAAGVLGNAN